MEKGENKMKTWKQIIMEQLGEPIAEIGGLASTAKNSNLYHAVNALRLQNGDHDYYAVAGAHRWQGTEGWHWYIYRGRISTRPRSQGLIRFYQDKEN
jgi:hypothetical protein